MTRRYLAALGLVLTLGACTGPPAPAHHDAFQGLYNASASTVPVGAPAAVQPPVGIIFSDNFENWFKFIQTSVAYWRGVVPASLTNTVAEADGDPNYLGGRTLEMLKRRFPGAEVVKDFQTAVRSGKKAVILMDVRARPMQPYGDRTTHMGIDAYFFDSNMNPTSKLSGDGSINVPIGGASAGFQVTIDQALRELEGKLNAMVR